MGRVSTGRRSGRDLRPGPTVRAAVQEWCDGALRAREDRVITEEPLEVRLAWPGQPAHRLTVTMRTPGADFELAAGLVVGEGVARAQRHIATVAYCTDTALRPEQAYNVVTVTLTGPPQRQPAVRHLAQTSACGVCGKESLDAVLGFGGRRVNGPGPPVPAALLGALPDRLRQQQRLFDRTGAVHAAGLFGRDGEALVVREDVGRHNAVDKVVGALCLGSVQRSAGPGDAVLCTSARAGFEIVQKAVMAGIPVVAAVGAASSLAVDCAREYDVTLLGFVRGDRFVVYSRPDRVAG
jgi:FdhD protein